MKNKGFLSFSFLAFIVLLISSFMIILILGYIVFDINNYIFEKNIHTIKNSYVDILKKQIKSDVINVREYIKRSRIEYERMMKEKMVWRLNNTISVLKNADSYNRAHFPSRTKSIIKNMLLKSKFYLGSGFYMIIENCDNSLKISTKLSRSSIKIVSKLLKNFSEGFVYLYDENGRLILSYIKYFENMNMYIASCMFMDEFEGHVKINILRGMIKDKIANRNKYVFINDVSGNIILMYNKIMFGRNVKLWSMAKSREEEKKIKNIFNQELNAYRKTGGDFISYDWYEPKTHTISKKISFIYGYKPWRWIIGEGFYENEISSVVSSIKNNMLSTIRDVIKKVYVYIFALSILICFVVAVFFIFVDRRIKLLFSEFERALKDGEGVDVNKYKIFELRGIAGYINDAICKFKEYENEFLEAFIYAIESRDIYTKGHSQRVAMYAKAIAKYLGFSDSKQDEIYKAGLLHDIGKIGVPDNILLKPGRLTPNEYKIIKHHSIFSYEIVSKITQFKSMANYIKHHHERCDGSGYPDGLKCEEISIEAKILAIADVFDALTSKRAYRDKIEPKRAIRVMEKDGLDKKLIDRLKDFLCEIYIKESSTEYHISVLEEVESVRKEIFTIDYMTGLKRRNVFIKKASELIKNNKAFAVFYIDIKGLSFINYSFSTKVGDKMILYTAIALSKFAENMQYKKDIQCLSRAYNDAFLFILEYKNNEEIKEVSKILNKELVSMVKALFIEHDKDKYVNESNESILNFIGFHIIYSIYPYEANDVESLIYKCMNKKRTNG